MFFPSLAWPVEPHAENGHAPNQRRAGGLPDEPGASAGPQARSARVRDRERDLTIEDELSFCLRAGLPAGRQAARNVNLFLYFYGFRDAVWPTLEEAGEAVGIGTRERVRQILGAALAALSERELPSLRAASRRVRSRRFWSARELAERIAEKTGDSPTLSMRGLLNLMHDLGLARGYDAYSPGLARLTRSQVAEGGQYVLARNDSIEPLQWGLHGARRLSMRYGLISATGLADRLGADAPLGPVMTLLQLDPACWTQTCARDFWYAAETPDNVLVGLAAKAFAVAEEIAPERLADTLFNALRAKVGRSIQADRGQIACWIGSSRLFRLAAGRVSFQGQRGALTPLERQLASYLSAQNGADYPAIRDHLRAQGQLDSTISKMATQSPFVHVDRSGGMRSYRYSLVGPADAATPILAGRPAPPGAC